MRKPQGQKAEAILRNGRSARNGDKKFSWYLSGQDSIREENIRESIDGRMSLKGK
jgi:hypothetical protein